MREFEPELVIVSAGFDAHTEDPLASMNVTEDGFRALARRSAALAPRCAAVLEGGYNLSTLPRLVGAALEGFRASRTPSTWRGTPSSASSPDRVYAPHPGKPFNERRPRSARSVPAR